MIGGRIITGGYIYSTYDLSVGVYKLDKKYKALTLKVGVPDDSARYLDSADRQVVFKGDGRELLTVTVDANQPAKQVTLPVATVGAMSIRISSPVVIAEAVLR